MDGGEMEGKHLEGKKSEGGGGAWGRGINSHLVKKAHMLSLKSGAVRLNGHAY